MKNILRVAVQTVLIGVHSAITLTAAVDLSVPIGDAPDPNNSANETAVVTSVPTCSLDVTNTNDSGPGSLRAAIECANSTPGRDTISFNIPGPGVHTIAPLSPLPSIIFPVVIDGYTQPGSSANTLTEGDNAVLLIEVRGDLVSPPFTRGLEIFTGDCVIRGLVINRLGVFLLHDGNVVEGNFIGIDPSGQVGLGGGIVIGENAHSASFNVIGGRSPASRNVISGNGVGISIQGPTHADSHDNLVLGNYIGTDASGTHALPNQFGLYIYTSNNQIGDTAPEGRNIISGNVITGLIIQQASSNVVVGNFFGTDVTGRNPVPNSTSPGAGDILNPGEGAIHIIFSDDNVIGGTQPGAFNVISGNDLDGIQVVTSSRNLIQGNLIGTASDGVTPLPNVRHGIFFRSDGITFQSPTNNLIGGATPAARNVIAFNGGNGIFVAQKGTNDSFLGNSIFSNAALGINLVPAGVFPSDGVTLNDPGDLDVSANNLQNFPILSSAASSVNGTRIQGTLNSRPGTSFTVEFFSNRECDPSGYGEGETFLGRITVMTDSNGNAAIDTTVSARVPGGQFITSTAADSEGNTSEFSQCIVVTGIAPRTADLSVSISDDPDPGSGGANITYTITVGNNGPDTARGVRLTNTLPTGVTLVSAPDDLQPVNGVLSLSIGSMPSGQSLSFKVEVAPTAPGELTFSAVVVGDDADPDLANNSASETTVVTSVPTCALVVTNTEDSGPGSLRVAIECANSTPGRDTISFNIPGEGVHTVAPLKFLPWITDPVVIDGYTQPGSSPNSLEEGDNAVWLIELRGGLTIPPFANGLEILTTNCIVRGLLINGFYDGIAVRADNNIMEGNFVGQNLNVGITIGGLMITASSNLVGGKALAARNVISGNYAGIGIFGSTGNSVQGNYIGTDASGLVAIPNQNTGLFVYTSNSQIGDAQPSGRNLISGNGVAGMYVSGSSNKVLGNYIGTDATGMKALPNSSAGPKSDAAGISILNIGSHVIGGTEPNAGNLISGNESHGIQIIEGIGNTVQGNLIGTAKDGLTPLPNKGNGIVLKADFTSQDPRRNLIGDEAEGRNIIAFNGGNGILAPHGFNNSFFGNSVYSNGGLGIDLAADGVTSNDAGDADSGANNLQNFPVLTSAVSGVSGTKILGTLSSTPGTSFTIEFFANRECDPSGNGEGETFIGRTTVTTDANGAAPVDMTVSTRASGGQFITSTATDPEGNTSEFSRCVAVTGTAPRTADLSLSISDAPDPASVGDHITYTITVRNDGPDIASGVRLTNTLPTGVTFVSAPDGAQPVDGVLSLSIGSLTPGQRLSLKVRVAPTAAGGLTFSAVVVGDAADPDLANNSASEMTVVITTCSWVITNTEDSGRGSLRAAIECANSTPGPDTISFNIPGLGVHTIFPGSPLPPITDPVVIDGYTQPNSRTNSLFDGSDAILLIELSALGFGETGLGILSSNCTIRGLVINGFYENIALHAPHNLIEGNFIGIDPTGKMVRTTSFAGISIGNSAFGPPVGDLVNGASFSVIGGRTPAARNVISGNHYGVLTQSAYAPVIENVILGNFIGTDASGLFALPNSSGILVVSRTQIGDGSASGRNLISGNLGNGILANLAGSNVIRGNYIGTDVTGMRALPNSIAIKTGGENVIGGVEPGSGNVISGNSSDAIQIEEGFANIVQGNLIGVGADGRTALPNSGHGIRLISGITFRPPSANVIGGLVAGGHNVIAFNGGSGVQILGANNPVLGNSIFSNGGLGIDLEPSGVTANDIGDSDAGVNNLQNFPVVTSALSDVAGTKIQGTLNSTPGTSFTIEFFASRDCDLSGNGEGEIFLGRTTVTTDQDGNAPVDMTVSTRVSGGQFITSTATDPDGNTSEFSQCIRVEGPVIKPIAEAVSPLALNPQTGLFEQTIRLSNPSITTVSAAHIFVHGLPANAQLYNAISPSANGPFVRFNQALLPGSSADLLLEDYLPDRVLFSDLSFTAEEIVPFPNLALLGTVLSIDRNIQLRDGRFLVELSTVPGHIYAIQYSGDMRNWKTVIPSITAPANRLQWLDDGPPKTETKPTQLGSRFYRVLELP